MIMQTADNTGSQSEECTRSDGQRTLQVMDIVAGTSVDGPGLRTSIYLAGCAHHCHECHNPQTWAPDAGHPMSVDDIVHEVEKHGFDVTLTGGDPMYNAAAVIPLARRLREAGYRMWCYTGYHYEEICNDTVRAKLLQYIDVLVDGPYVHARRDISLLFRGSSNQRLIDCERSTPDHIVLWSSDF